MHVRMKERVEGGVERPGEKGNGESGGLTSNATRLLVHQLGRNLSLAAYCDTMLSGQNTYSLQYKL